MRGNNNHPTRHRVSTYCEPGRSWTVCRPFSWLQCHHPYKSQETRHAPCSTSPLPITQTITTTLCWERFRTNCIMSSIPMANGSPRRSPVRSLLVTRTSPTELCLPLSLTQPNSSLTFPSTSLEVSCIIITTGCSAVLSLTQWHSPLLGCPRGLCFYRIQRKRKGPVCSSSLLLINFSFLFPKTSHLPWNHGIVSFSSSLQSSAGLGITHPHPLKIWPQAYCPSHICLLP